MHQWNKDPLLKPWALRQAFCTEALRLVGLGIIKTETGSRWKKVSILFYLYSAKSWQLPQVRTMPHILFALQFLIFETSEHISYVLIWIINSGHWMTEPPYVLLYVQKGVRSSFRPLLAKNYFHNYRQNDIEISFTFSCMIHFFSCISLFCSWSWVCLYPVIFLPLFI